MTALGQVSPFKIEISFFEVSPEGRPSVIARFGQSAHALEAGEVNVCNRWQADVSLQWCFGCQDGFRLAV